MYVAFDEYYEPNRIPNVLILYRNEIVNLSALMHTRSQFGFANAFSLYLDSSTIQTILRY